MTDTRTYYTFIAAVVLLMLLPGPNVALIVAHSVVSGASRGLITVLGTVAALVLPLMLLSMGLIQIMNTMGLWLTRLRIAGAAYLIYLGIVHWRRLVPTQMALRLPRNRRAPLSYRRSASL